MSKGRKNYQLWVGMGLLVATVTLAMVLITNAMKGKTADDMTISGGTTVDGLTCKNNTLEHPAFVSKPASAYTNTITAIFRDDKLSSISLLSEGTYETEQMAQGAEAFAAADYNLTLSKRYGEKSDIFSNNLTVNGTKLQLAQTTRDISKINANTVTYFLLDHGTSISKTLSGLKRQYEENGFSCEKSK